MNYFSIKAPSPLIDKIIQWIKILLIIYLLILIQSHCVLNISPPSTNTDTFLHNPLSFTINFDLITLAVIYFTRFYSIPSLFIFVSLCAYLIELKSSLPQGSLFFIYTLLSGSVYYLKDILIWSNSWIYVNILSIAFVTFYINLLELYIVFNYISSSQLLSMLISSLLAILLQGLLIIGFYQIQARL